MPATLALALIAIIGGALLTYLYDRGASLAVRMGTGACTGYALLGSVGTLCASIWQLDRALVVTTTVFILVLALLVFRQIRCQVLTNICASADKLRKACRRPGWREVRYFIFYGFLVMLLWRVFDRVMFESEGEIFTAFRNNLGDLPFHLQVISSFVYGHNFPPKDPTYAGARFTYPFISDVVAAMFVRCGATLREIDERPHSMPISSVAAAIWRRIWLGTVLPGRRPPQRQLVALSGASAARLYAGE